MGLGTAEQELGSGRRARRLLGLVGWMVRQHRAAQGVEPCSRGRLVTWCRELAAALPGAATQWW